MFNLKKDLFKIFQENKDEYDLYEKTIKYIENIIKDIRGTENANFYNSIIRLLNSINNAGWEERHSEQIQVLFDIQNNIIDEYGEYI